MTDEERDLVRFAPAAARALCGVDRRTWERWRAGRHRIPRAALALLRILTAGELPQGGDAWSGWRFWRGELYAPTGEPFTPYELLGWSRLQAELRILRAALRQARERRSRTAVYITREEAEQLHQALALLEARLPCRVTTSAGSGQACHPLKIRTG